MFTLFTYILKQGSLHVSLFEVMMGKTKGRMKWTMGINKVASITCLLFKVTYPIFFYTLMVYRIQYFPFGIPPKVFKTRLLGRGFHTLIKNVSFSPPTNMGSYNPPHLELESFKDFKTVS